MPFFFPRFFLCWSRLGEIECHIPTIHYPLLKPPPPMFPNVVENVATTFCNQNEDRSGWIGLQERVLSWLHGIHDAKPEPCHASSSTSFLRRVSKDRRRHHYSPYPMRCEPPRALPPSFSHATQPEVTIESDFPASASEIFSPIWHVQENIEYRSTSLIEFKVADDLPDPEYNPLVRWINHWKKKEEKNPDRTLFFPPRRLQFSLPTSKKNIVDYWFSVTNSKLIDLKLIFDGNATCPKQLCENLSILKHQFNAFSNPHNTL